MITSKELHSELRKPVKHSHYQKLSDDSSPIFAILDHYMDKLCGKVRMHGLAEEYVTLKDAANCMQAALIKYSLLMEKYGDTSGN